MRRRGGRLCWLVALVLATGCEAAQAGNPLCENLDETNCLLPFPSDHFRPAAAGHLLFPPEVMPQDFEGRRIDPSRFASEGFPTATQIYFALEGATLTGTAAKHEIARSIEPGSKTLIVDAVSGERVAHWVEYDYQSEDAFRPTIALRLAAPLAYGRRYVVAVRGLVDAAGETLPATRGFAALRDGRRAPLLSLDERRDHFEAAVFPVLETLGVERGALQLAWDFTTTSENAATRQLLAARDKLMALIGSDGPEYTITNVEDFASGPIATMLTGLAKVPNFLEPKDAQEIKRLRVGADGLPEPVGTVDVEFTLQIPRVTLTAPGKAAVMQYGHGFLGRKAEANNGWLREWANRDNFLILATDMEGMNEEAGITWFKVLPGDASYAPELSGWPFQGIMNHLALQRLMKGRFLTDGDPRYTNAGQPWYDPARMYYHGNSQGGTIGNIVIALSSDITRAMLGVPGCAFTFLVSRATQWQTLGPVIEGRYPGPRDMQAILGLMQIAFDRFEPANFVRRVTVEPFPGLPAHQVLLHVAKEDAQVNNDVSEMLGRVVGARLLQPALRPVYGLQPGTPPTMANAYVEFDYGVPDNPAPNRPTAAATDPHGEPRRNPKAQAQAWRFFETGVIDHFCDGACNPE